MTETETKEAGALDALAIGAHPDDVELTIGGTLLHLIDRGYRIGIIDLTRGELGSRGTPQVRAREAEEARHRLGAEVRENLDLGDGRLEDRLEGREGLVDAIRRHRPRLLLGPVDRDLHPDHESAGRLVRASFFLAGLINFSPGRAPHRPDALLSYFSHTLQAPDLVIDVSATFERKRHACLAYRSQFFDEGSDEPETFLSRPDYWEWWEARARHYGQMINASHGEPFQYRGPIPVDDPVQQFSRVNYYSNRR